MGVATIETRPGLHYFPDAESYDEKIAELRAELGRNPTIEDLIRDLIVASQLMSIGDPCRACGEKETHVMGAYVPDWERVELIGYALCKPCGERWEGDADLRARVNAGLHAEMREQLGEVAH